MIFLKSKTIFRFDFVARMESYREDDKQTTGFNSSSPVFEWLTMLTIPTNGNLIRLKP